MAMANVAQLVEPRFVVPVVVGSSPIVRPISKKAPVIGSFLSLKIFLFGYRFEVMVTSSDYIQFKDWVHENNKLYVNFTDLKINLENYLKDFSSFKLLEKVSFSFDYILHNCDKIDYQDDAMIMAYIITHFLDRYRRFQMIFLDIFEKNLYLLDKKHLDVLDVGTGPAPALFALNDMCCLLDEFFHKKTDLSLDYVEKSMAFRNFLHHFVEISGKKYKVPYHHGSFYDFENMEFDYWIDVFGQKNKVKRRYDIVIMSNFLTDINRIHLWSNDIKKLFTFLRHKGIILVVGARQTLDKYQKIYDFIDTLFIGWFSNWKFRTIGQKVCVIPYKYDFLDSFGNVMSDFDNNIVNLFKSYGIDAKNFLEKVITPCQIQGRYCRQVEWVVHMYLKKAFPKKCRS